RHVREPVRFADGVGCLSGQGVRSFLELGPEGVLSAMTLDCLPGTDAGEGSEASVLAVPVLREGRPEARVLMGALAEVWVRGVDVDWGAAFRGTGAKRISLPTYAFQRRRHWLPALRGGAGDPTAIGQAPAGHPLLGAEAAAAAGEEWSFTGGLLCVDWTPIAGASAAPATSAASAEAGSASGGRAPGGWAVVGAGGSDLAERLDGAMGVGDSAAGRIAVYADLAALGEAVERGEESPGATVLVDLMLGGVGCAGGDRGVPGAGEEVAGDVPRAAHESSRRVLGLVQEWLGDERLANGRLVLLTCGAVAVGKEERALDLAAAPVWGLVRSAQAESPGRFVLVDLDGSERSWRALTAALACDEPQLALREGVASAPRLAQEESSAGSGSAEGLSPERADLRGTVLVTGGTGGLGALVARHLVVERGVRSLVLASRRGREAPGALELEAALRELGAEVAVAACDVSDRSELEGAIELVPERYPLCGVVHTAGVLDDGVIGSLTGARLDAVLAPKVDAAWHLHELTRRMELELFVLFSSAAGVVGSPGQGNYAAGNAFLDVLAAHRRSQGLAGVSIAWGAWAQDTGMTSHLGEAGRRRMERAGLLALSAEEGLELLDAAGASGAAQVVAMHLDGRALRALAEAELLPALFRGLVRVPSRRSDGGASLARRLADLREADRERVVLELVCGETAAVLGHPSPDAVDSQQAFKDMGFTSLMAVELRNRLSTATGLTLPTTLVFDYPDPAALAGFVLGGIDGGQSRPAAASADAELIALERAIAAASSDPGERVKIEARLQALLSAVSGVQGADDAVAVAQAIESATADEVIAFIDGQLGRGDSPDLDRTPQE
ncbi:MAG: SDR family NAD(P)-dependent oxidoreductase, partial [Solirubrobacteraceae bacterium]